MEDSGEKENLAIAYFALLSIIHSYIKENTFYLLV